MLLTIENIQNQQFNQRFRGYDMAEVDAFLDKIAESYLFLSTENNKIKEELDRIKKERTQSIDEEQSFKNAIISAQSFADDIKSKAESHATRLKEDAKEKSTSILENAQQEMNTLQDQISLLAGEKERIKDELRSFLNTYLSHVDEDSLAIPQPKATPPAEVVSMDQIPGLMAEPTPEPDPKGLEIEGAPSTDDDAKAKEAEDVAILYEKIELNDDFSPAEPSEIESSEPPAAMNMEIEADSAIPEFSTDELEDLDLVGDLEGDMLYSLEDPLDLPEPAVVIDPLEDEIK